MNSPRIHCSPSPPGRRGAWYKAEVLAAEFTLNFLLTLPSGRCDDTGEPVGHPHTALIFDGFEDGHYNMKPRVSH